MEGGVSSGSMVDGRRDCIGDEVEDSSVRCIWLQKLGHN